MHARDRAGGTVAVDFCLPVLPFPNPGVAADGEAARADDRASEHQDLLPGTVDHGSGLAVLSNFVLTWR